MLILRENAQDARKTKRGNPIYLTVCTACVAAVVLILGLTAGGMIISHESITQDAHAASTNNLNCEG